MLIILPFLLLVITLYVTINNYCKKKKAIKYQIDLQIAEKNFAYTMSSSQQLYGFHSAEGLDIASTGERIYA